MDGGLQILGVAQGSLIVDVWVEPVGWVWVAEDCLEGEVDVDKEMLVGLELRVVELGVETLFVMVGNVPVVDLDGDESDVDTGVAVPIVVIGVPLVELGWPAVDIGNDVPEVDTCVDVPVVVIAVPFVKLGWTVVDLGNDVPVVDFAVVVTEGGWEEAVVIKLGSTLLLHKSP